MFAAAGSAAHGFRGQHERHRPSPRDVGPLVRKKHAHPAEPARPRRLPGISWSLTTDHSSSLTVYHHYISCAAAANLKDRVRVLRQLVRAAAAHPGRPGAVLLPPRRPSGSDPALPGRGQTCSPVLSCIWSEGLVADCGCVFLLQLTLACGERRTEVFVHSLELGHTAGTRAIKAMGECEAPNTRSHILATPRATINKALHLHHHGRRRQTHHGFYEVETGLSSRKRNICFFHNAILLGCTRHRLHFWFLISFPKYKKVQRPSLSCLASTSYCVNDLILLLDILHMKRMILLKMHN